MRVYLGWVRGTKGTWGGDEGIKVPDLAKINS